MRLCMPSMIVQSEVTNKGISVRDSEQVNLREDGFRFFQRRLGSGGSIVRVGRGESGSHAHRMDEMV